MHAFTRIASLCLVLASLSAQGREAAPPALKAEESGTALTLASTLSALAQKQAKLYLQLRLGVEPSASQRKLDEAVRSFDSLLPQFEARNANGSAQLTSSWADARQTLAAPTDMPMVKKASQNAEQLSSLLQQAMAQQAPAAAPATWRLADLAARNAVLAQRLARVYMQQRVGDGDTDRQAAQQQMRKDFVAALDELTRNAASNANLRMNLGLVKQQWMFFDAALTAPRSDEEMIRNVATSSERISEMMGQISSSLLAPARDAVVQAAR